MEVLQSFVFIITAILLAPVFFYCAEMLVGSIPLRDRRRHAFEAGTRPQVAVLVPAHNEASGIGTTLASIRPQLGQHDRLIVIADNCSDNTAAVARDAQAEAIERRDELRRGKGFALAFGLESLLASPPEVVLFLDADCTIEPGTIDALVDAAVTNQTPAQSLFLCEPKQLANTQQQTSGVAFRVKNLVRALGLSRLGGPCHLTGSGIALPWSLVDKVPWATGNVVEDMQLGIDYSLAGYPPVFVPEAIVRSEPPPTEAGLMTQRRRWEHGFLTTALTQVPELALHAWERKSWTLWLMACDMAVPPLALLSMMLVSLWCMTCALWLAGFAWGPLLITTLACFSFAGSTIVGWLAHCRDIAPPELLRSVPRYVISKLPLYLSFLYKRQLEWIRTERRSPWQVN